MSRTAEPLPRLALKPRWPLKPAAGSALLGAALLAAAGLMAMPGRALAAPDGVALYTQHCAACHQVDAGGTVGLAPTLKGEHWAKLGADRGYLPMVLVHGLSGPIQVGSTRFVGSMPAFSATLDDEALAAIANHLRSLQGAGGAAAAYTAEDFAAARRQPGSPPQTRMRRQQALGQP